jgi:CopA family copper-resistance protein
VERSGTLKEKQMKDRIRVAPRLSRRQFVHGLGAGAVLASLGVQASSARAATPTGSPTALSGTEFNLDIVSTPVNFTGAPRTATAVNGQIPAPTLYWREADTVTLRVTNHLADTSSIHWHGILVPNEMDGVPGVNFTGIAPGGTYVYRIPVKQSGTYWYHSHSKFQEQTGLYGPLIIEPRNGERFPADREHVVMLSDWTDTNPEYLFTKLKKQSDFSNFNRPTVFDFTRDVSTMGLKGALERRRMWNRMRMNPTDFVDVTGFTYTYLLNGATPSGNWTGLFRPGEKVRLRFINGSANSIFDVRIPGLKMTVISADGQDVDPVSVDEFRISAAETYDVMIEPHDDRAYTLYAQSIDRSGYARGTLAPRPGMQAEVPQLDRPQWLSMIDMMGAMTSMEAVDNMSGMAGMGANRNSKEMSGMAGMDHSSMQGMDHGAMGVDSSAMKGTDHGSMAGMQQKSALTPGGMRKVRHARTEYGPNIDMHVDMPRTNLDDPGINLRDNGRRVLTYADLHTIGGPLDPRSAEREIELHLTGHMERFVWSFDGLKFSESKPVHFRYGERVRVVLVNDTMMTHPIHLHGMFSEVETPDEKFLVRKHTVNVQPAQRVTFLATADALGHWAFHCHLLYHMEAGMFREVVVS